MLVEQTFIIVSSRSDHATKVFLYLSICLNLETIDYYRKYRHAPFTKSENFSMTQVPEKALLKFKFMTLKFKFMNIK